MPTAEKATAKLSLVKLEYHPTIHDMPSDERPRERLKHYGPKALSTAELLAIILRTGTSRDNVIELAGKLLAKYGGLSGLMRADFNELCSEHGLGEAKSSQLKAALEMGRRLGMLQNDEKYQFYFACPLTVMNVLVRLVYWLYRPLQTIKVCCQLSALLSVLLSELVLQN
jgi:DNA repair protein RadC